LSYHKNNDENLLKQNIVKSLFIIFVLLGLGFRVVAQIENNNVNRKVDMKFLFPKLEATANKSVFNILKIKNTSNFSFIGKVKLIQPDGWNIIGENEIDLNIETGDSLLLPVRIIAANNVLGEVAYAIVASLLDKTEVAVFSEYCFVNIPRISDLKIESPNRVIYFDNKTETAKFQYKLKNRGNINELVQLNFGANKNLAIDGKDLDAPYSYEYNIPAYTDTIVEIKANLRNNEISSKDFFQLDINAYTQDSLYKKSLWINKVNSSYSHIIPQKNKCAIIELMASDIISSRNPRYSLMAKGSVLLKNNLDIYYYYRNFNLEEDFSDYYNDRGYIGIKNDHFKLQGGIVQNIFNELVLGLGGISEFSFNRFSIGGHYSNNEKTKQIFYGGNTKIYLLKKANISLGYSENNLGNEEVYSKILFAGAEFSFLKKNRLSLKSYLNSTSHELNTPFEKQGFAILGNYTANYNRLKINGRIDYGSPEYTGISRGKNQINVNSLYFLNNSDFINFSYSKFDIVNIQYVNDVPQPAKKTYFDNYILSYNRNLNKYLSLTIGPGFSVGKFNIPYIAIGTNEFFKTTTPKLLIGLRYNDVGRQFYLRPKIEIGQVSPVGEQNTTGFESVNIFKFNLYSVYKDFNLFLQYQNGPTGIFNQYYYFTTGYLTKWIYVMPSFNKNLFNNKINLDFRANYRYDIALDDKYLAFNTVLKLFLPDSWTLWLLNSVNTNTKRDLINNSTLRYTSVFFEAGIRKEFNCKQPRFQYYDLDVVFFKDLNGNRVKERNEPGLRNVLASIEPDYDIENSNVKKDFVSQKLLTGSDGTISYTNIVNGAYKLKYILIGDMVGNFNREEMEHQFMVTEDKTVYIPYLENNRIIGKVILNRDPLSSLGNLDISNIRVIAEDTRGHTYSALTDKQGNFILYTPVTDYYIVKINNIFYESFDLQQPEFVVKFNGYKQFEVTFVFTEKKRKINFDTDVTTDNDFVMDDLKAIRKTTLSGKIWDAISLEPVDATIEIIDNKTNKVVSSAISNKLNGNYSISYVANENYRIEVKAEGYWDHVENLYIEQVISIQNIAKDIMLNKTSEGPKKQTFIIYDEKEEENFTENFKAGQKIPMNNLNFAEKETRLSPNLYPELDRLIDILEKNRTVRIEVAGHADDTGKERIDNLLALRRAKAVARYLTSHGLNENRIEVKSYSNKRPLVPGISEKAKQKNRRVEIIVL
jgi:outer membrane protein OmpA-like peptidoglycan-associated protein